MANDRALTTTRIPRPEELGVATIVESGQLSEQQVAYYVEQFKGCPAEDIRAFFWTVEKYGLNPFGVAQIYGIPRSVTLPSGGTERRLTVQVGINGLVAIAQRTGRYAGMTEPQWCGEDGVWRTFWNRGHFEDQARGRGSDKYTARVLVIDPPAAARVGVSIKGQAQPSWFIANWIESADFDTKGNPRNLWKTKPALMLAKVAAAGALRRTFQDDFASLNAEFTVEDRPAARISDLYPEPDLERPRLNAGFVTPPGMDDEEEAIYQEQFEPDPAPVSKPRSPASPTDKPDVLWSAVRDWKAQNLLTDADLVTCLKPSPAKWVAGGHSWTAARDELAAFIEAKREPPRESDPAGEIEGFEDDGTPIRAISAEPAAQGELIGAGSTAYPDGR